MNYCTKESFYGMTNITYMRISLKKIFNEYTQHTIENDYSSLVTLLKINDFNICYLEDYDKTTVTVWKNNDIQIRPTYVNKDFDEKTAAWENNGIQIRPTYVYYINKDFDEKTAEELSNRIKSDIEKIRGVTIGFKLGIL